MKNKIYVISGMSAVGKDSLFFGLNSKKNKLNKVVSSTSRPKRKEEIDSVHYNFLSKQDFEKEIKNNNFLEFRKYYTHFKEKKDIWYYGINKKDIKENSINVVILDIEGKEKIEKIFGKENVTSILLTANKEDRINRIKKRGDFDPVEWERREDDDKKKFTKEKLENFSYIIENNNLNKTIEIVNSIIEKKL